MDPLCGEICQDAVHQGGPAGADVQFRPGTPWRWECVGIFQIQSFPQEKEIFAGSELIAQVRRFRTDEAQGRFPGSLRTRASVNGIFFKVQDVDDFFFLTVIL